MHTFLLKTAIDVEKLTLYPYGLSYCLIILAIKKHSCKLALTKIILSSAKNKWFTWGAFVHTKIPWIFPPFTAFDKRYENTFSHKRNKYEDIGPRCLRFHLGLLFLLAINKKTKRYQRKVSLDQIQPFCPQTHFPHHGNHKSTFALKKT